MLLFRDIKQNYPVYILDKNNLTFTQGKVAQISFPHIDSSRPSFGSATPQNMVVDVTIVADSKTATYTIPENLGITETASGIILATEKDSLAIEVETLKNNAELILSSIDKQKQIVEKADKLLLDLNPGYKEKIQYEERFKNIESGMSDIKNMLSKLFGEEDNAKRK